MEITLVSAEQYSDRITLTVTVDGNIGSKSVDLDSDLKVEAEILAAEIVEVYKPKPEPVVEVPVALDVSKIVLEVKTMEEALEAKEALEPVKEVVVAPAEEPVI